MSITIKNTGIEPLRINDLAIEVGLVETVDISSYPHQTLLESADLPFIMSTDNIQVRINGVLVNYTTLVEKLTSMTPEKHEALDTLKHNVSEAYYFETTKDVNGQTKYITYYKDSTKQTKIKEEEIIRSVDGTVSVIIIEQYDSNNNLIKTEVQTINRGASGRIENITVETN